ncbi:MAG: hypothetical protein OXI95_02605 [bacterium]|nr:hypothetical protein [bacterium]
MAEIVVKLTLRPVVMFLIEKGEGRSARELAKCILGPSASPYEVANYEVAVSQACGELLGMSMVKKEGAGIPGSPFRYYPMR